MDSDESLTATLRRVYDHARVRGRRLNWHEKLTSVWRPYYAPFREMLEWVPKQASILDIGCGSGAFLFLCADRRHARKCVGIDANVHAIELAKFVTLSPVLSFNIGVEVPLELVKAANVITMVDILHHIPRAAKASFLSSILDSAQSGTRIIVKDLDPSPPWMAIANRATDYLSTRSRVDYISRSNVEERFRQAGIDVVCSQDLRKHVWSHYLVVGEMKDTGQLEK
jgi:2-polyprenyl-3-methyl-5-hydroxy-6-metoxy-1,4-benzoquinol methylase